MSTVRQILKQPLIPCAKMKGPIVICGGAPQPYVEFLPSIIKEAEPAYFIGVDRGALTLLEAGYPVHLAIGDFDSVSELEMKTLQKGCDYLIAFPPEKDETDMELALLEVLKKEDPSAPIYIIGGLGIAGGRLDHLLANLLIIYKEPFTPLASRIHWVERDVYVRYYVEGEHRLTNEAEANYLSFINLTPISNWSLEGAKYPLKAASHNKPHAYISNEFVKDEPVILSFHEGPVIALWVKEASRE